VGNRRPYPIVFSAVLLILASSLTFNTVFACASLEPDTVQTPTYITAENAVIIWDKKHHIEHFIRQAQFLTQSPDIGFLVPTPDTPEVVEVSDQIFDMAAFIGQPQRIPPTNYRSPWTLVSPIFKTSLLHLDWLSTGALMSGFNQLQNRLEKPNVLAERDVAGYHVTTLAAEDEQSLSAWLTTNGYLSTPELKAWLQPYVDRKWKITAFKLMRVDQDTVLNTRAIRLSFRAARPFYPYSEPSDRQLSSAASPQGRALRVAILSDQRMAGTLADANQWPGRIEYAGPSTPPASDQQSWTSADWLKLARLDDGKYNMELPAKLTAFIDESNPRPGTADLYLSPDQDQSLFRGQAVDLTLPPQDRIVFSYSLKDFAAILTLIILPAVPIYCGWKVLNQPPEEEINPRVLRYKPLNSRTSQPTTPQRPQMHLTDILLGGLAIVLGIYFGAQFFLLVIGQIAAALLGWSDISGNWIWAFGGMLLAIIPVTTAAWGVIYCGVNVWRVRKPGKPLRSTNPFYVGGAWQGFMGASSLLAGSVASLAVLGVLASLL
jgi:hypothetical protein